MNIFSAVAGKTPDVVTTWLNGGYYVNVHTPAFPGGEIRGQIARRLGNGDSYFNFFLQASEAASTGSLALTGSAGSCAAALRQNPTSPNNFDFIVACLHNIPTANVTAAVVGGGAIGGSTSINVLNFTLAATPFIEGRFTINAAQQQKVLQGLWFVRIDTALGSIRGQIVDSTSAVYPKIQVA